MPIREYECSECGHVVEKLTLANRESEPPFKCPACGFLHSMRLKLPSSVGVVFKGDGWTPKGGQ